MASLLGGTGKSRARSATGFNVPGFLNEELLPSFRGVLTQQNQQLSEALRTGGIGARIPQIQATVEQARSGFSRAVRDTEASLQRSGLAGTPFGQRTLADLRLSGEQQISQIPAGIAAQAIQGAPQFSQGVLQSILGALASQSQTNQKSGQFAT